MNGSSTGSSEGMDWLCYDASCGLCSRSVARFQSLLQRHGFGVVPLQAAWVRNKLGLSATEPLREIKLVTPEGAVLGGVEVLARVARHFGWLRPLGWLLRVRWIRRVADRVYAAIAARRYRVCSLPSAAHAEHHHHLASLFEMP